MATAAINSLVGAHSHASSWTPASLTGLLGWWDFSDTATITQSGGQVSQVNDKSGNGNHLVQATGANQPITGTRKLNGLDCLDFTPNQYLSLTFGASHVTWSTFGAFNLDAYGNWGDPWKWFINKNRGNIDFLDITGSTVLSLSTTYRFAATYDDTLYPATRNWLYINGSADGSGNYSGTADIQNFTISANGDSMNGRWGEFFVTSTLISDAPTLASADSYLSTKWGTS